MPYNPDLFERALSLTYVELRKSSQQFVEEAYRFDWLGLIRSILFLDEGSLARHANEMLGILLRYESRLFLLPARVATFMAAERASFPEKLSNRVLRADTALSFTLKEVIDTGFELASGNFVPLYDVFKGISRVFDRFRVFAFLDSVAFLRLVKGTILAIVLVVLKIIWAIVVTIATFTVVLTLVHKWNQDSTWPSLKSNFLSDDSKRIRRWIRKRKQFRVNLRPGPDKE